MSPRDIEQERQDKIVAAVEFLDRRQFVTMREFVANKHVHGIGSYDEFNRLQPAMNGFMRQTPKYEGLALSHYIHHEEIETGTGKSRDFWLVTGSTGAIMDALDRLFKNVTTRTYNLANKAGAKVIEDYGTVQMQSKVGIIRDLAFHTGAAKDRYDTLETSTERAQHWSTAELESARARWIGNDSTDRGQDRKQA